MKLEPLKRNCPKCGNGDYMRRLVVTCKDEKIPTFDVKCINCNRYFRSRDFKGESMAPLKEQQKDWITDKLPDKPGLYLCTFYGDSIMENYVAPCEYICKPYYAFNKFLPYDYTFGVSEVTRKDLTNDVIAWMPFPEPYNKLKEE